MQLPEAQASGVAMAKAWLVRAAILAVACLFATCASASFVQKCNSHQLCLDGKPFYFVGANSYW